LIENQISFESCLFYGVARQYDQEALRVIASVFMDEKQPAALRLAAANDLLDRGRTHELRASGQR
jgi:hypothetical protein